MCVPGLAAYLRAAEAHLSDTEPHPIKLSDTPPSDTPPSEEPRPALVSASGTTDTEGRA